MTPSERKAAKMIVEADQELSCESFGFGADRRLMILKRRTRAPSGASDGPEGQTEDPARPSPALAVGPVKVKNTFIDDWDAGASGSFGRALFSSMPAPLLPLRSPSHALPVPPAIPDECDAEADAEGGDVQLLYLLPEAGSATPVKVPLHQTDDEDDRDTIASGSQINASSDHSCLTSSPPSPRADTPPGGAMEVRNTFIHIQGAPADKRVVQSMPHGMFAKALLEARAAAKTPRTRAVEAVEEELGKSRRRVARRPGVVPLEPAVAGGAFGDLHLGNDAHAASEGPSSPAFEGLSSPDFVGCHARVAYFQDWEAVDEEVNQSVGEGRVARPGVVPLESAVASMTRPLGHSLGHIAHMASEGLSSLEFSSCHARVAYFRDREAAQVVEGEGSKSKGSVVSLGAVSLEPAVASASSPPQPVVVPGLQPAVAAGAFGTLYVGNNVQTVSEVPYYRRSESKGCFASVHHFRDMEAEAESKGTGRAVSTGVVPLEPAVASAPSPPRPHVVVELQPAVAGGALRDLQLGSNADMQALLAVGEEAGSRSTWRAPSSEVVPLEPAVASAPAPPQPHVVLALRPAVASCALQLGSHSLLVVEGLSECPGLNGCLARVLEFEVETGKYRVIITGADGRQQQAIVKRENLRHVPSPHHSLRGCSLARQEQERDSCRGPSRALKLDAIV